MNCAEAQQLLSAYFDGELARELVRDLDDHVSQCTVCAAELASFGQLSRLAGDLPSPPAPDTLWCQLEQQLNEDALPQGASRRSYLSSRSGKALALAATLLVAVGLGWWSLGGWDPHGEHDAFAAEFGHYLDEFHRDPASAQQMLVAKYNGVAIDPAGALHLVGYQPATSKAVHDQYRVTSTHVLTMPCCTCVQTVCQRPDGSTVVIFEHDDENPQWFADRRETTANCSGKRCRLFDVQNSLAASWSSGGRHITVIGARDASEVGQLVSWLQDSPQPGA